MLLLANRTLMTVSEKKRKNKTKERNVCGFSSLGGDTIALQLFFLRNSQVGGLKMNEQIDIFILSYLDCIIYS